MVTMPTSRPLRPVTGFVAHATHTTPTASHDAHTLVLISHSPLKLDPVPSTSMGSQICPNLHAGKAGSVRGGTGVKWPLLLRKNRRGQNARGRVRHGQERGDPDLQERAIKADELSRTVDTPIAELE